MALTNVNPTRMELTRLKKKLVTAVRGHKLLKDKRDELMRRYLEAVRENKALREKVETRILQSNKDFILARGAMSDEALKTAFLLPKQQLRLDVQTTNVMSVDIPVFQMSTRTSDDTDIYCYGYAYTSADLDAALDNLAKLLPDMIRLAQIEKSCRLMADEIEKTRRRVNALEHVMIPQTQEQIKYISMKLDENERSTQIRLMKVKDMMLKQSHHYQ